MTMAHMAEKMLTSFGFSSCSPVAWSRQMPSVSTRPYLCDDWFVRSWADRIQRHYFPKLGKVEWEVQWTGCIDFTPDHLMRLFEPAQGLIAVAGYNGRGNTTGTVIGQAMADYLLNDKPDDLPMPFSPMINLRSAGARSFFYEAGFSLYHAGQCLRVIL